MELSQFEVLDVAPCDVPPSCPPGVWPCGNCGGEYPVERNWVVSYRARPVRDVRKTLVCEHCAAALRDQPRPDDQSTHRTTHTSRR